MYEMRLTPTYWANVSGGKDSLFMLKLILSNPENYPLNGVVHFELEIDYPFIKNVIDYMQSECEKFGIPFLRIKPRVSWYDLYEKYGFPSRRVRWCNNPYKIDSAKQLEEYMKKQNKYVVRYVGFCADEIERIEKKDGEFYRFPLAENGIEENVILEWAKTVEIFNDYYLTNKRCGCMFCPLASRMELAYLCKHYPQKFEEMLYLMEKTETAETQKRGKPFAIMDGNPKYNAGYIRENIRDKWLPRLEELESGAKSLLFCSSRGTAKKKNILSATKIPFEKG